MSTNNNSNDVKQLIDILNHKEGAGNCTFYSFTVNGKDVSNEIEKRNNGEGLTFRSIVTYVINDIKSICENEDKENEDTELIIKFKKFISDKPFIIYEKNKFKCLSTSNSKVLGDNLKGVIIGFNKQIKESKQESEQEFNKFIPDDRYKLNYTRDKDNSNQTFTSTNKRNEKLLEVNLKNLIDNGTKQIIITGPPGTGKTRVALELAKQYMKKKSNNSANEILEDEEKYFVQFHPSYDYTDFVEGLRPFEVGKGNETKMVFRKVDGIFKEFCRNVVKLNEGENKEERIKNNKYFFIIDEINRADLSKVLGELMFSLEGDKRGSKNRVQTQYNNIGNCYDRDGNLITKEHDDKSIEITREEDCFKKGFYIPENVIIIGTMNDIDRSVESMDFALRRRFTWVNAKVDTSMLLDAFNAKVKKNNSEEYELDEDGSPKYVFFNHIKDDRKIIEEKNEEGKETIGYKYKNTEINKIINTINELNYFIKLKGNDYSLNENYFISQGYFKDVPQDKTSASDILNYVWKYRLESLLYEYVRGEKENNIKTFISTCEDIFTKNKTVKTDSNSKNITEEDSTPKDDKASNTSKSGA